MNAIRTSPPRPAAVWAGLVACVLCLPSGPDLSTLQAMETPKAERLYPVGRKLLFSLYSVTEPQLGGLKDDGYTAIGPYYSDKQLAPERSRVAGLPYLHSVGPRIDFGEQSFSSAAESAALDTLIADVTDARRQPGLAIWYLANEEPRFWRADEMSWLDQSTNAIRIHDPGQRPIMVYEPNHRIADELATTGSYVDAIAKGSYANLVGMKDQRSWIRWSVEQVVAAADESDALPVSVLLMFRDQESAADIAAIGARARHDVFLSMVAGAKGILIYSGDNSRPGFERDYQAFYDGYASAARDLNLDKNLAEIFLFGEPGATPAIDVLSGPDVLSFDYRDETHSYPSVSTLTKSMYGRRFLFLVNSANVPVAVSIDVQSADGTIEDYLDDRPLSPQEVSEFVLPAYAFRALAWNP